MPLFPLGESEFVGLYTEAAQTNGLREIPL